MTTDILEKYRKFAKRAFGSKAVGTGLTNRDLIALVAMHAILTREGCTDALVGDLATEGFAQSDAERSYTYADAMLERREES